MKKLFLFLTLLMGVSLSSWAQTATDNYLDMGKVASVNEAYSQSTPIPEILKLYEFTDYEEAGVSWFTMPVYSAYRTSVDNPSTTYPGTQGWIKLNPTTSHNSLIYGTDYNWPNTSGINPDRSATSPFYGHYTYFGENAGVYGYPNKSTEKKSVSFYVTNVNEVRVYLNPSNNATGNNRKASVAIYECTKNGNTLTASTNAVVKEEYSGQNTVKIFAYSQLSTSKFYKVELTQCCSRFYEIAFKTPFQKIEAAPTSLDFETRVGTPVTQTFHVSGTNLIEPITATLSDPNGVFSLSTTSVSVADGTAGTDITVTFDPQEFGTYNGTITLSSGNAEDVVINLIGNAIDGYDLVISSAGLSTLYLDYPVSIPYDTYDPDLLGVFYIYGIGSDTNPKELLASRFNNIIPANTGVIVQGNSNTSETPTYFFPRISDTEAATYTENSETSLLSGSVTNITVNDVEAENPGKIIYTLGRGKDNYINFYRYSGTTLAANKAFILVDASTNVKSFTVRFDGDATGINTVDANNVDGAWYNLQGIKMQGEPTSKGVFIHNGKKYVVK